MSKNITIQEGGVGKTLSYISKLETKKQGGGSVIWIPEDEVKLKTKNIKKNGTYIAEDDNANGYSQVTVNVKTVGTKEGSSRPGGSGNDNEYAVDVNEDGEIIEKMLPSKIQITTQPTKKTYHDGEDINTAGMVVKAYGNDDLIWESEGYSGGVIPLSEITIEPTKASAQGEGDDWTSDDGINAKLVNITYDSDSGKYVVNKILGYNGNGKPATLGGGSGTATLLVTKAYKNGTLVLYVMRLAGTNNIVDLYAKGQDGKWGLSGSTTAKSVYNEWIAVAAWTEYLEGYFPLSTRVPDGSASDMHQESTNTITVKWKRPEDDEELTAEFTVAVEGN